MSDLDALLERLEKATGPDRELDEAIMALFYTLDERHIGTTEGWDDDPDSFKPVKDRVWVDPATDKWVSTAAFHFTASIDAALALVERVLPGWMHANGNCGEQNMPWACITEPDEPCRDFSAGAPTEPLAILIALLRALSTIRSTHP